MADAAVLGFRGTKALRGRGANEGGRERGGAGAVVKLKAAENLLEQTDDGRDERQANRPQPPMMVAQRLVRMVC